MQEGIQANAINDGDLRYERGPHEKQSRRNLYRERCAPCWTRQERESSENAGPTSRFSFPDLKGSKRQKGQEGRARLQIALK